MYAYLLDFSVMLAREGLDNALPSGVADNKSGTSTVPLSAVMGQLQEVNGNRSPLDASIVSWPRNDSHAIVGRDESQTADKGSPDKKSIDF